jgi:hypothetical protein
VNLLNTVPALEIVSTIRDGVVFLKEEGYNTEYFHKGGLHQGCDGEIEESQEDGNQGYRHYLAHCIFSF